MTIFGVQPFSLLARRAGDLERLAASNYCDAAHL
jgi:hypothetical protein